MKINCSLILIFLLPMAAFSQWGLSGKSVNTKEKWQFQHLLDKSVEYYKAGQADSMRAYTDKIVKLIPLQNDSLRTYAYRIVGNYYYLKNDYVSAITNYTEAVKIAESHGALKKMLPKLYNNIGFNYYKLKFTKKSLEYLLLAKKVSTKGDSTSDVYIFENLAETHIAEKKTDSAMFYIKKAEKLNPKEKTGFYPDNYIQASLFLDYAIVYDILYTRDKTPKYKDSAACFYKKAIDFSNSVMPKKDFKHLSSAKNEYAGFLSRSGNPKLAKIYAEESLTIAQNYNYKDIIIDSAVLLQQIFESQDSIVMAYKYSKIKTATSNELAENNDSNHLISVTVTSEISQQEHNKERERNIKYLLWAIGLITALVIFFLLSHTIIVNARFITFVGNIGLLIVFEFINMIIHPFIDHITDSTLVILLVLVILAVILVKIHRWLEHYIRYKLVEKNRQIRIEKAEAILKEEAEAITAQF